MQLSKDEIYELISNCYLKLSDLNKSEFTSESVEANVLIDFAWMLSTILERTRGLINQKYEEMEWRAKELEAQLRNVQRENEALQKEMHSRRIKDCIIEYQLPAWEYGNPIKVTAKETNMVSPDYGSKLWNVAPAKNPKDFESWVGGCQ